MGISNTKYSAILVCVCLLLTSCAYLGDAGTDELQSKVKQATAVDESYTSIFPVSGTARTSGGDLWVTSPKGVKTQVTFTMGQVVKYLQSPNGQYVAFREIIGSKPGTEKTYKGLTIPREKVVAVKILDLNTGELLGAKDGTYLNSIKDDAYYEGWTEDNLLKMTQTGAGSAFTDYLFNPATKEFKTLEEQ